VFAEKKAEDSQPLAKEFLTACVLGLQSNLQEISFPMKVQLKFKE